MVLKISTIIQSSAFPSIKLPISVSIDPKQFTDRQEMKDVMHSLEKMFNTGCKTVITLSAIAASIYAVNKYLEYTKESRIEKKLDEIINSSKRENDRSNN
jgi:hypothetical protein